MAGDNNGLPFINEDDRRIRDLQAQENLLLSDFLAMDRPGLSSAMRFSVQQIVDGVNANLSFIRFYAGSNNPDNALGANGDGYYVVPADASKLQLFQKIDGVWLSVFNLPIDTSSITKLSFTQADLIPDGTGSFILPFNLPVGGDLSAASTKTGNTITRIDPSLATTDLTTNPNSILSGFPNNSAQIITLKII